MSQNTRLLVLELEESSRDQRIELRIDRTKALNAITSLGARVRHDSGGRLIVIEISEQGEKLLADRLTRFRLVPVAAEVRNTIVDLDANELLFLEALKIRHSKEYRDAKKRRKVGESPEEKQLSSGSCIREY